MRAMACTSTRVLPRVSRLRVIELEQTRSPSREHARSSTSPGAHAEHARQSWSSGDRPRREFVRPRAGCPRSRRAALQGLRGAGTPTGRRALDLKSDGEHRAADQVRLSGARAGLVGGRLTDCAGHAELADNRAILLGGARAASRGHAVGLGPATPE